MNTTRRAVTALLSVGIATSLVACGNLDSSGEGAASGSDSQSASGSATRTVKDDLGTQTVPANPKRIVATGYAVPALLEAKANLVGISTWSRGEAMFSDSVSAAYKKTTKISGDSVAEMNYEAIAKAKPDVIVLGVPKPVLGNVDVKRLRTIAPVVAIGPSLPSAWRSLTKRQMEAVGLGTTYQAARTSYEKKAAALKTKYADALGDLKFAHIGAYGDPGKGNFQREYKNSWGTNIAQDIGVNYYGHVKKAGEGSKAVAENLSIEDLPTSLKDADAITYTVDADGTTPKAVQYVLKSSLWKNLKAVKNNMVFPVRYSEAATYTEAELTLGAIDKTFARLLTE